MNPELIRDQIMSYQLELLKVPKAQYDAELIREQARLDYQKKLDIAFLLTEGNIEERKATARQKAEELEDALVKAKAEFNRITTKHDILKISLGACQSLLKSIQAEGA
jgi:hypothetical protein